MLWTGLVWLRIDTGGHFRNSQGISDRKINNLAMPSKNKNISDLYRRTHELKMGYHPPPPETSEI
jgi:hypothetical protein